MSALPPVLLILHHISAWKTASVPGHKQTGTRRTPGKTCRKKHTDIIIMTCTATLLLDPQHWLSVWITHWLRQSCLTLCEQTAENWRTAAVAITRWLCVKRATVCVKLTRKYWLTSLTVTTQLQHHWNPGKNSHSNLYLSFNYFNVSATFSLNSSFKIFSQSDHMCWTHILTPWVNVQRK